MLRLIAAARAMAAEQGMDAVQIVPVADAGRHRRRHRLPLFPRQDATGRSAGRGVAEAEIAAMRGRRRAAPGPLSALAASHRDLRGARDAPAAAGLGRPGGAGRCRDLIVRGARSARRSSPKSNSASCAAREGGSIAGHQDPASQPRRSSARCWKGCSGRSRRPRQRRDAVRVLDAIRLARRWHRRCGARWWCRS